MTAVARRRWLVGGALAVVVVVFAVWLIVFSSVFGVRSVEVDGLHTLTAAQVRTAAGIADGTPLVRLDTAAVTRRVERLPEVASAQVSTSFPSTVTVQVVERTPVGYVANPGPPASFTLVDATGSEYRTQPGRPAGLAEMVLPDGPAKAATAAALGTVAAALPASVARAVISLQALDPGAVTLALSTGGNRVLVQWGGADHSAEKARILPTLLATGPSLIDLTDPTRPFTR